MKYKIITIAIAVVLSALIRDPIWICVILAGCLIYYLVIDVIESKKCEKQIRELTDYMTRVQDLSELPAMQEIQEGSLGILQSELYKVITILKEEYASEHKQKKYISDMMSDISHQFKTPLTAIQIMTDLMMAPELSDQDRLKYVANIESQVNRMTWLIRNLLTLSQLEAGVLPLKSEDISLAGMMQEISTSLSVMADAADVKLSMQVPEQIHLTGDSHWLRESFTNIIKNAIEHTPAGGKVEVTASQNNISTEVKIEDNGKGIPKEHLPHIFERFYKAGNASPNSVGIGLAMAKQIINNHDGKIDVESEEKKGTCMKVTLYR